MNCGIRYSLRGKVLEIYIRDISELSLPTLRVRVAKLIAIFNLFSFFFVFFFFIWPSVGIELRSKANGKHGYRKIGKFK